MTPTCRSFFTASSTSRPTSRAIATSGAMRWWLARWRRRGRPRLAAALGNSARRDDPLRLWRHSGAQIYADRIRADGPLPLWRRAFRGARDDRGGDRHPRAGGANASVGLSTRRGPFPGHRPDGPRLADLEGLRRRGAAAAHVRQCGEIPAHDISLM